MRPVELAPNRPRQFYRAGGAGAAFRGVAAPDPYRPEEWMASTTTLAAVPQGSEEGLTRLPGGRLLREAVAADPERWFGPRHAARLGADPALLVKLLDAGERLPVHLHPSRPFAADHLGSHHGKTEAWVVLATEGSDPAVWLGFRHDVDTATLQRWVSDQDAGSLLGALHRVPVAAGDAILVPAGLPHAIGAGILCLELQEPTDFSLNLEWAGYDVPDGSRGQLGLDPDTVLACVRRSALSSEELDRLRRGRPGAAGPVTRLLPPAADPFFRVERVRPRPEVTLEAAYAVLVVTAGDGTLTGDGSPPLPLRTGGVVLVPWGAGPQHLRGEVELLRCLPPDPDTYGRTDAATHQENHG